MCGKDVLPHVTLTSSELFVILRYKAIRKASLGMEKRPPTASSGFLVLGTARYKRLSLGCSARVVRSEPLVDNFI